MSDPSTYNFYRRRQLTSINSVKRLRRKTASTTTTLSASNVETSYASTTAASKAGASAASAASARSSSSTNVYFLALLLSGILLLGLFTVKTWTRNYDWNSRRALFRWVQSLLHFAKVLYTYTSVRKEIAKSWDFINLQTIDFWALKKSFTSHMVVWFYNSQPVLVLNFDRKLFMYIWVIPISHQSNNGPLNLIKKLLLFRV